LGYDTVASRLDGVIGLILQAHEDCPAPTASPRRRAAKVQG
jgi:hypothetical protein